MVAFRDSSILSGTRPLFDGAFDRTGALSSPWHLQRAAADRIRVAPSPADGSGYAARFEVHHGDSVSAGTGHGNRAEIYARGPQDGYPDGLGSERWYSLSLMVPSSSPVSPHWQVLTQWKNEGAGSPPLAIGLEGNTVNLTALSTTGAPRPGKIWQAPVKRDAWTRLVVHVKWSPDRSVGFVEMWRDGARVVPLSRRATMYRDSRGVPLRNYLKVGLYRSSAITETQVTYASDVRIGRSYAAVAY